MVVLETVAKFWELLVRIRLTLAIAAGLLLCSNATIEIPELVHLTDDTSNDYSLVVFVKNSVTVIKGQVAHRELPASARVSLQSDAGCSSTHSLILPSQTSGDMLHLLCVQRT